jgi:hypothetical protein
MKIITVTTFAADGQQISVEEIELPDAPTVDLVALVNQVTAMNEAVDYLVINSLGGS